MPATSQRPLIRLRVLELGAVLQYLPANVATSTLVAVHNVVTLSVRDPASVGALVKGYARLGIAEKTLEEYLGHPLAHITVEEYRHLALAGRAIKDRETDWAEVVAGPRPGDDRELTDEEIRLRITEAEQEGLL